MYKIILASHGQFVSGVMDTLGYFINDFSDIFPVSLDKKGLEKFNLKVNCLLDTLQGEDLLVFTDFLHGTPFNVFAKKVLESTNKFEIIAGMNMPAVLEAVILQKNGKKLGDALSQILKTAQPVSLTDKMHEVSPNIDDE